MPVDERRRLQLANAAKRILGDDEGITLMELLPPVGWGDVATKQDLVLLRRDLEALESRLESRLVARFEKGFRQIIVDHGVAHGRRILRNGACRASALNCRRT